MCSYATKSNIGETDEDINIWGIVCGDDDINQHPRIRYTGLEIWIFILLNAQL